MGPPTTTDNTQLFRTDSRTHVLLDVYKIYQQVQKNFQGKEVQAFATLLVDTYKSYSGIKTAEGNLLEVAMRCCQQQNLANKIAASHSHHHRPEPAAPLGLPSTSASASSAVSQSNQPANTPVSQPPPVPTSPQAPQPRKPYKTSGTGRPRGRPPNSNKHLQSMQSGGLMNQYNSKSSFSGYLGNTGNQPQPLMNPFFMNPLLDQNMISAMMATGLGGNMMDPLATVNYLTQMGNYQDILRQYQNNLSSMGSLAGFSNLTTPLSSSSGTLPTMSTINTSSSMPQSTGMSGMSGLNSLANIGSLSSMTVQQLLNLQNSTASTTAAMMYNQSKPTTTTSSSNSKEHHSISITPVTTKKSKHIPGADISHMGKSQKPLPSPTQVSLLKPSVIQPPKSTPPKQMSAPQIRVSKSLTEPQPAHNSSLSVSPMKSASPSGMNLPSMSHSLQSSGLNIKPVSMGMPGTSLQHKLLSKKQGQMLPSKQSIPQQGSKKRSTSKSRISGMSGNYQSLLGMGGTGLAAPFIPSELSGISVSPVTQAMSSKIPPKPAFRKSGKSKGMDMSGGHSSGSTSETYSMLSQLQQHSHLEIIPQKTHKNIDFAKSIPHSLSAASKGGEGGRSGGSDSVAVYEVPRKGSSATSKKADKSLKDNVEIITLDD